MHPQFMQHSARFFGRQGIEVLRRQRGCFLDFLLGLHPQFARRDILACHYETTLGPVMVGPRSLSVVAIPYTCPSLFNKAVETIETSRTVPSLAIRCVRYGARIRARLS